MHRADISVRTHHWRSRDRHPMQRKLYGKENGVQTSSVHCQRSLKQALGSGCGFQGEGREFTQGRVPMGTLLVASLSHSLHCKKRDLCSIYLSARPDKPPTMRRLGNH